MKALTLLLVLFVSACAPIISTRGTGETPQPTKTALVETPNALGNGVRNTPNALGNSKVTAAEALNVRKEPLGVVIDTIRHASTVTLTGRCSKGWAQITWKGATAWVKASFLSENKCQKVTGT
jgi:uncharacterized protein YgiM (DUF1202 family)